MNNYLNEVTSRSVTRFSIDAAQQALEFLKKINDGKDIQYKSIFDDSEETTVEINNSNINNTDIFINSNQSEVELKLTKAGITFEHIPNSIIKKINPKTFKYCKFVCLMYTDPDKFVNFIKEKINEKSDYLLYLYDSFIRPDESVENEYKIYYYLWTKDKVEDDNTDLDSEVELTKLKLEKIDIIKNALNEKFDELKIPTNERLKIFNQCAAKLRYFHTDDGWSSNTVEVLDYIKNDLK